MTKETYGRSKTGNRPAEKWNIPQNESKNHINIIPSAGLTLTGDYGKTLFSATQPKIDVGVTMTVDCKCVKQYEAGVNKPVSENYTPRTLSIYTKPGCPYHCLTP